MYMLYAAPDAPSNITIEAITATTVSISWTDLTVINATNIIQYKIEVTDNQFGLPAIEVITAETSVVIAGLEEYNNYSCKIAVVSKSQIGTFSSLFNFTTLEAGNYTLFDSVG